MTPAGGDAANPELRDMTRRFWVGVALSVPLLAMAMAEHFAGARRLLAPRCAVWVQLVLATPAVLWGGWPFFRARLGFGRQPAAQHVHADRARHRRRLCLQPGRGAGARDCFRPRSAHRTARCRSISRRRRSSSRWCCSARSSNCAPARRPAAPSARCSISRPKRARLVRDDGARGRHRARRGRRPAIACACAPARRCRSTASCSKGRARSTSR